MSNGLWSNAALNNYQRARSGPVTITKADGSTETVGAWEMEKRRREARRARARARRRGKLQS